MADVEYSRTCVCCRKEYKNDYPLDRQEGDFVDGDQIIFMGLWSRHEMECHKFTLIDGWYCYECLDKEIDQNLTHPLLTTRYSEKYQTTVLHEFDLRGKLLRRAFDIGPCEGPKTTFLVGKLEESRIRSNKIWDEYHQRMK